MNKQLVIGLLIGLVLGSVPTYMYYSKKVEAEYCNHNHKAESKNTSDSLTIQWVESADTSAQSLVPSYRITEEDALTMTQAYNGNLGVKGWHLSKNMLESLLSNVQDGGQSYPVSGVQVYIGKNNAGFNLIFGSVYVKNNLRTLNRANLWDYNEPCPNNCPQVNGL